MLAQGFDLKKNAYNNRFQPYISYWGAAWNIIFILINGYKVFFKWNVSDFLTSCEYRDVTLVRHFNKFRQTSIFPSSWDYTYSGKFTNVRRSGKRRKWTLSRYAI